MKILAINGSHRAGKNVSEMLQIALNEAAARGAETELVELAELNIEYCVGCNRCLFKPECSIKDDDMTELKQKMLEADAILLGSPNYFSNVSGRMKTFMDRTRPLHMVANALKGKVGGCVCMTGLDHCGAEQTVEVMERWFTTHEMNIVRPRPEGPVRVASPIGSLLDSFNDDCLPNWRRGISEDKVGQMMCAQLGKDVYALCAQLEK